jgi:hypothetical protein
MNIIREQMSQRKAELEKKRTEQTLLLQQALAEEKAKLTNDVLIGLQDRMGRDAIKAYRAGIEKDIAETCLFITSIEEQLANIPEDDSETLAAAKEAAFLEKFEEMQKDILPMLPALHRAFVAYNYGGKCSLWPAFLLDVLQFRQPSRDEWRDLKAEIEKTPN